MFTHTYIHITYKNVISKQYKNIVNIQKKYHFINVHVTYTLHLLDISCHKMKFISLVRLGVSGQDKFQ